jgi:hypothetical protein
MPPLQRVEVVAVDRLAELEHHVVRDVDERAESERMPASFSRATIHAGWAGRVDVAHDARDEHDAADAAADRAPRRDRREPVAGRLVRRTRSTGSRKRGPGRVRVLAATPRIENA